MEKIRVNNSYDVMIDSGLLDKCGELIASAVSSRRAAVITDDNVDPLYSDRVLKSLDKSGIEAVKFVFHAGEAQKCHKTLISIYDFLMDNRFNRSDFLIALGGGVVGDITGFAAATYMRGIPFVQIPTTVLAQVDSSVGGKTAVNIEGGKNIVGSFYRPSIVICDTDALKTLTPEIFSDGMAEVIKYGMIKSYSLFEILEKNKIGENMTDIIKRCVEIKAGVVDRDEFEKGERMTLNFGHTLGHAIEKYYNYNGITHGNAVATGMSVFTEIAAKRGICDNKTSERLNVLLEKYNLPTKTDAPIDKLYEFSLNDKKRLDFGINIVLCSEIGISRVIRMSVEEYKEFLNV